MLRKSLHRENAHVFLYSIILYLFLFATLFLSLISLLKVFFSLKLYIANAQKEQNNVQTFISTNSVFHNYIYFIFTILRLSITERLLCVEGVHHGLHVCSGSSWITVSSALTTVAGADEGLVAEAARVGPLDSEKTGWDNLMDSTRPGDG